MYYQPKGLAFNDFEVVEENGEYHVFHIQGVKMFPYDSAIIGNSFGHATSNNLIEWNEQPTIMEPSRSEQMCDNASLYTMSVIKKDGLYFMFYTGLGTQEYKKQRVCMAVSKDLYYWEKYPNNPIVEADSSWYRTDGETMSWRDPFILYDNVSSTYYMYICARSKEREPEMGGCIAVASSSNLFDWEVHPPIYDPKDVKDAECPVVYELNGTYYLFYSKDGERKIRYLVSDRPNSGFREVDTNPLSDWQVYANRITEYKGQYMFLHTIKERHGKVDTGGVRRGYLAPPKILEINKDGKLALKYFCERNNFYELNDSNVKRNGMIKFKERFTKEDQIIFYLRTNKDLTNGFFLKITENKLEFSSLSDSHMYLKKDIELKEAIHEFRLIMEKEYFELYINDYLVMVSFGYAALEGQVTICKNDTPIKFDYYKKVKPNRLFFTSEKKGDPVCQR